MSISGTFGATKLTTCPGLTDWASVRANCWTSASNWAYVLRRVPYTTASRSGKVLAVRSRNANGVRFSYEAAEVAILIALEVVTDRLSLQCPDLTGRSFQFT